MTFKFSRTVVWGEPTRLPLPRSFIELGGRIKEVQRVPAGLAPLLVLFVFKGFKESKCLDTKLMQERGSLGSAPLCKLLSAPAAESSRDLC